MKGIAIAIAALALASCEDRGEPVTAQDLRDAGRVIEVTEAEAKAARTAGEAALRTEKYREAKRHLDELTERVIAQGWDGGAMQTAINLGRGDAIVARRE